MLIRSSVLILLLGISGGKCEKSKWDSGVRLLTKLHDDCQNLGIVSCVKIKAISFFDRADLRKEITLNDQLSIVRDDESRTERKIYAENELEKAFPRGNESELNEILIGKILDFFNGHKIVFRLPKIRPEEIREQIFEGKFSKALLIVLISIKTNNLADDRF